jgi:hypothetical protein
LSFLDRQTNNSQEKRVATLYESQFSLTICGPEDSRWVAYGFVDRVSDDESDDEESPPPYGQDLLLDPISDGHLDVNRPIWDPRIYFLRIFQIRIRKIKKEWENVIYELRSSILQRHSLSQRGTAAIIPAEHFKERLD